MLFFHHPDFPNPPPNSTLYPEHTQQLVDPQSIILVPSRFHVKLYPHILNPLQFSLLPQKPKIGMSACLTGINCRYDGGNSNQDIAQYDSYEKVIFCPEQLGNLPTPREPADLVYIEGKKMVLKKSGGDVTENFEIGANNTLSIIENENIIFCLLKKKSPSCGVERGGITATLLQQHGFIVKDSDF